VIVALGVYGILLLSRWPGVLKAAAALMSMVSAYEMLRASGMDKREKALWMGCLASGLLAVLPLPWESVVLMTATLLTLTAFLWMMSHPERFRGLGRRQHIMLAAGISLLIRALPALGARENGMFYLLMAVTVSFLTDVFAYHVGKRYGKHALAPRLSPHKTVEGSVGGTLLTLIAMFILKPVLAFLSGSTCLPLNYFVWTVVLSVAAQLGDLSMSAVKRIDGVKDFGTILPGHGGILDRFDSHIFVIALLNMLLTVFSGFSAG